MADTSRIQQVLVLVSDFKPFLPENLHESGMDIGFTVGGKPGIGKTVNGIAVIGNADTIKYHLCIPRSNDGWFYVKMMSDPETMAYNAPWFPPDGCIPDPDSGWVELQKSWIGKAPERFYAFLQRKTDGAFVGDVNYHHNPKQSWCDMGIVIFAPERGKGYGKQGLRLLLDRAFKVDGVSCLHNDFEDARVAAYRIHKAVGFRETGTLDRIIHLELTREDYLKGISVCCDK